MPGCEAGVNMGEHDECGSLGGASEGRRDHEESSSACSGSLLGNLVSINCITVELFKSNPLLSLGFVIVD